jgi:uncharacterized protein
MSTEPLPRMLDVRKAAARGLGVSGALEPKQLPRLRSLLASDDGRIDVEMAFSRDEENRDVVRVGIDAEVVLICQRCLDPLTNGLTVDDTVAIVWTDEQAARLPRHLEPLLAGEAECNLWELVEEELILALPAYSYHETAECRETLAVYAVDESDATIGAERANPFDVLAQLKPGKKH